MVKKMNEIEMLNYIYQTSKIGIINIDNIKSEIKNKNFLKNLQAQQNSYFEICNEATDFLFLVNKEREEISNITKVMIYIDSRINTMNDNSLSNIIKLLISKSTERIIDLENKINDYNLKNKKILSLCKKLLRLEKSNIEKNKKYLK